MNYIKIILITLFIPFLLFSQESNFEKSAKLEKAAFADYSKKNYDSFLTNMKEAEKLRPNHPRLLYNLAAAYSLNNYRKDALSELKKLVNMKLYFQPEKDSDFVDLWNDIEFKDIITGFDKNLIHTGNSITAFTYPQKDLITESVAYDSKKNKFYLSSVYRKMIVSIDSNGNASIFKNEGEDGLWSALGIKVDSQRRLLWACTAALKQTRNYKKEDLGKTAVYKYNIDSKKLIKKYELDNKPDRHLFGDLALSTSGNVYVSDSWYNAIYKIPVDSDSLEIFIQPEGFVSLQGLDLSQNNKFLFFSDYALGLFKINFETNEIKEIQPTEDFTSLGIDGLYFYNNSLIATQNGVNPQRTVRIYLNDNMDSTTNYKILGSNNPYFDEITLGLIIKDDFYFIANAQWGSFDKEGKIFPLEKLKEPRVLKIKLTED